jgi:dihydrodipicolinate synthase/N-acetylneuraminate lyase
VVSVNLSGQGDTYFIELKDRLRRDVDIYVPFAGSLNTLGMGAAGLLGAEANIIPKTHRLYIDLYEAGKTEELARVYADVRRFGKYVARYHNAAPRWIKMALRLFRLPGGAGGVRPPYLPPVAKDVEEFAAGLLALRIPEIDELAKAAGLSVPSA